MIRPAVADDLPALVHLERSLFESHAWNEHQLAEELDGPGRWVAVSDDADGDVAGYVVTRSAGDLVDLMRIGVRRDRQRRGLAGILLTAAVDQAQTGGATRMLLEVGDSNAPAIALYHGHGFVVIDRRRQYYPDGSDALIMQLQLPR